MNSKRKFVGIDLHSNRFNTFTINEDGSTSRMKFELTSDSLNSFFSYLDKNTYILLESSTNSFKFHDLIKDKVKEAIIAHPQKLKLISFVDKKTDKVDAEKLAKYLKMQILSDEILIEPVYIPEQTIRDLRSLFTTYSLVKKQMTSVKNRIHSILKQNLQSFTKEAIFTMAKKRIIENLEIEEIAKFQINMLYSQIDFFEEQKNQLEKVIKIIASKYIQEIDILTSMAGISVLTAIAIIADIADISRFKSAKKMNSYLRSTPGVDSSNEKIINKSTSKCGRKLSITLLTQSYIHFKKKNIRLIKWINKNEGKKRASVIRMAVLRNIFSEVFHMLKNQEYNWYRDENLHTRKMKEYFRLLEKNNIEYKKVA